MFQKHHNDLNCIKIFIQYEIVYDICKQEIGLLFGSQVDKVTEPSKDWRCGIFEMVNP